MLLDVIKQKHWQKLSLRSLTFSWQCASTKIIGCSASSLQLWICSTKPSWAPSNYFLIRNLKYRLRGTWFLDDESLKIAVEAWSESQNRKFYFQGINSWEQKLKMCVDVAWEYVKKWQRVWYNMLTFYSQVAKRFDRPSYICRVWTQ